MTVKELLTAARATIAKPENWCQNSVAEDSFGNSCDPTNIKACRWCAFGALQKHSVRYQVFDAAYNILYAVVGCGGVGYFNDTHTHAEVLERLDRAIAETSV